MWIIIEQSEVSTFANLVVDSTLERAIDQLGGLNPSDGSRHVVAAGKVRSEFVDDKWQQMFDFLEGDYQYASLSTVDVIPNLGRSWTP